MSRSTILSRFTKRFCQYAWLFAFILLMCVLTNWRYFLTCRTVPTFPYIGEIIFSSASTLLWAGALTTLVALWPSLWLRRLACGMVCFLSILLFIFENYLISAYKTVYTDSIAVNILATNPEEAQQFTAIIPPLFLLTPFVIIALILVVCYFFRHKIEQFADKILPQRQGLRLALILSPIAIGCGTSIPAQIKMYKMGRPSFAYMTPYERIPQGTWICMEQGAEVMRYFERIHSIDAGNVKQSKDLGRLNVILIMGESLRRDYMGCYGYRPNTTPRLDSLVQRGDIALFTDAVSPAPGTVASVLENLTFHRLDTEEKLESCAALLPVLSKAGFFTYWVSNQEKQGAYIQPLAGLAATADSTKYIKIRTSTNWSASYDGEIIPHTLGLDSRQDGKSVFQVVHLMGSHSTFGDRYPEGFNHFKIDQLPDKTPEGLERVKGSTEDKNLIEYINSIYYNDFVISGIINKHQNERSIVIYLADHGVEVHDNPDNPSHCGHPTTARGLKIPLMVYFSPQMRQEQAELWEQLKAAQNNKIMTDLLSHSVCNLLGVESKYSDESLSFFSPKYNNARARKIPAFGSVVEL